MRGPFLGTALALALASLSASCQSPSEQLPGFNAQECLEDCYAPPPPPPPPPDPQLEVTISGFRRATSDPVDYKALISNGIAPYFYYWSWRPCYKYYDAQGMPHYPCEATYYPLAEGWGRDSIRIVFPADVNTADLLVEVRDYTSNNYLTGVDTMQVLGPAFLSGTGDSGFRCTGPDVFPWTEYRWNPTTGTWEFYKNYRRATCTGVKEYEPEYQP